MAIDLKSLNQKTKKGTVLMYSLISVFLFLALVFFTVIIVNYNINNKAAILFEKAYVQILSFNDQTNIYSKQEMEEDIILSLDRVLTQYPKTSSGKRALFYKGYVFYNVGKYEEAKKIFDYFVKTFSKDRLIEKVYYYLSYCYSETNDVDKAIDTLKIFEQKYPSSYYSSIAYFRLGYLYEKKDKVKSKEYYNKVISLTESGSQKEMAKKRVLALENDLVF